MLTTRFTELVGCSLPIQQAAIGGLATPTLAQAVAEAGGLGMVCVYGHPPSVIAKVLDELREQTSGVVGANFIMHFVDSDLVFDAVATAAARVQVIEFFYSQPDPLLVEIVHDNGALAGWQVGSREEAVAAAEAGCNFIIAQGIEAGGHVRGRVGLLALLNEVLEAVDVPVLAAGGIGTGRTLAAVLAAGADGARIGTRFVAAKEAEAHPTYVNALIASKAEDTILTEGFSTGWPNAPHRVLSASLKAAEAFEGDIVGEIEGRYVDRTYSIRRFQPITINKSATGAVEAMPHWAGESVDAVERVQTAAEIVFEIMKDCQQFLDRWG